jgi:hypothetical protein
MGEYFGKQLDEVRDSSKPLEPCLLSWPWWIDHNDVYLAWLEET